MTLFKGYSNIKDFLHRFTILKIGKLHIRLHKIKDKDQTNFYHNHPFHYISIVLKGGYTEDVLNDKSYTYSPGEIICRKAKTYHRITRCLPDTMTLFFAWGDYGWSAINPNPPKHPNGVYARQLNGETRWAKRENDIWFISHNDHTKAKNETRHSIHQI